ncbi:SHOCT domain-containing protein [Clostridioides difficile]|uniref:SHOCT domain-containing protein n=2 Tax=Clostridioides difficile TaxID=1496 RepID=UPI00038D1DF2|nr:SHOCT domain-containing protein [Clostridioides difficile]EQH22340.1 short C-terminal domain protein [Clostridioides difficile DA00211]MCB4288077.1 SHOCT domain-containing protein [Clostridioides difficile]MCG7703662.1 SHOCT domain-containing protein [Clostridioides difficile]MCI2286669.1 SHOCT domain-containing protein [Clostridioides difficile]MCK3672007.1 SHOCT domain-containing protein [Clostridioides difficile]
MIADNKVETVKAQRETVEREKEMERRRIQEEVDKKRYIEKHGMEISENDLKVKLEALVPQEYKGKKYELKVGKFKRYSMYFDLTVQNEKFSNSEECKKFVKEIANDLKKIKISKAYFKFHSKDDGGIYNSVYIDYFRNIQNNVDNVENLEFNEFELKTEEEEKREQEKIEQEKNSYNNYIQNRVVDPLDRIKKLKELLDSGAITQEEYNKKKKELLE